MMWPRPDLLADQRPVDLNAIIDLLDAEIDEVGEVGIWGDYGPIAVPVGHIIRLVLENADAVENRTGDYAEDSE